MILTHINYQLTDFDEISKATWCLDSRKGRNFTRIAIAGTLSLGGTLLASYYTTPEGIIAGSLIAGVGNSASTYLAWEKKWRNLIEARLITDLPKILFKVTALEKEMGELISCIESISSKIFIDEDLLDLTHVEHPGEDITSKCARMGRNALRLSMAGGLSAAGSYLAGFKPNNPGIIIGGIVNGGGNAVSTWLAYELENDKLIEETALEKLPVLVHHVQETEQKLLDVIKKIKINAVLISEELTDSKMYDIPECWSRNHRNFMALNVAGWLSTAGGLVSGFSPTTPGILIGGAVGGVANSISTRLAWEGVHDKQMEYVVLKVVPKLELRIDRLGRQAIRISAFAEEYC